MFKPVSDGEIIAEWKRELKAEIERQFSGRLKVTDESHAESASAWKKVLQATYSNPRYTDSYDSLLSHHMSVQQITTPTIGNTGVGAWQPATVLAYTHTWRVGDTYTNTATSKCWKIVSFTGSVANCAEVGGTSLASCTVQTLDQALTIGTAKLGWRVGDRFRRSNSIEYTIVTASESGFFECLQGASTTTSIFDEMHLSHATRLAPAPVVAPAHFPSGRFTLQRDNSEWLILVVSGIELETECVDPGKTAYPLGHKKTFDANWAKSMSTAALTLLSGPSMPAATRPSHVWNLGDRIKCTITGEQYDVTQVDTGAGMIHLNHTGGGGKCVFNERVLSQDLLNGIYTLIISAPAGATPIYTVGPKHGDIYRCNTGVVSVWQVDGEEVECLVANPNVNAPRRHDRMQKSRFCFPNYDLQKPRDWKVGDRVQSTSGKTNEILLVDGEHVHWKDGGMCKIHHVERQMILGDLRPVQATRPTSSEPLTCTGCLQTFPYAEPNQADGTLKCWSCRNSG